MVTLEPVLQPCDLLASIAGQILFAGIHPKDASQRRMRPISHHPVQLKPTNCTNNFIKMLHPTFSEDIYETHCCKVEPRLFTIELALIRLFHCCPDMIWTILDLADIVNEHHVLWLIWVRLLMTSGLDFEKGRVCEVLS